MGNKLGYHVQVGLQLQEPGRCFHIPGSGGGVEETAGVLIDAERHERGLFPGYFDSTFLKYFFKNSGRGTDRLYNLDGSPHVLRAVGMMVIEVQFKVRVVKAFLQAPDPVGVTGINHYQAGNGLHVDVFDLFEFIDVAEFLGQEITDVLFLGTGKDKFGFRIEFFGCDHGRQAVKIRIDMGGYNIHTGSILHAGRAATGKKPMEGVTVPEKKLSVCGIGFCSDKKCVLVVRQLYGLV